MGIPYFRNIVPDSEFVKEKECIKGEGRGGLVTECKREVGALCTIAYTRSLHYGGVILEFMEGCDRIVMRREDIRGEFSC